MARRYRQRNIMLHPVLHPDHALARILGDPLPRIPP